MVNKQHASAIRAGVVDHEFKEEVTHHAVPKNVLGWEKNTNIDHTGRLFTPLVIRFSAGSRSHHPHPLTLSVSDASTLKWGR